jgi:hypothetical protein
MSFGFKGLNRGELIGKIVEETNTYARQFLRGSDNHQASDLLGHAKL